MQVNAGHKTEAELPVLQSRRSERRCVTPHSPERSRAWAGEHGHRLRPPRGMGDRGAEPSGAERPAAPSAAAAAPSAASSTERDPRHRAPKMAARSAAAACCPGTRMRSGTARHCGASGAGLRRALAGGGTRVRVPVPPSRGCGGLAPFFPAAVLYLFAGVLAACCSSFALARCRCRMFKMPREPWERCPWVIEVLKLPEEDSGVLLSC